MSEQPRAVVIGGGTMGLGIAYVLARAGADVQLVEPAEHRGVAVPSAIHDISQAAQQRGRMTAEDAERLAARIRVVADIRAARPSPHMAIEAVPESLALKTEVLREAQGLSPALLATNTSSISIDRIAEGLADPGALVGMHFFNPVWVNPLVELVVGDRTRSDVVDAAVRIVELLGKEAVTVRDRPGFATSRLGVMLGLEAIRMVEDGVAEPAAIDRAMELGYRHPMGPLRLTDLVGLDVRLAIAENLQASYGARFAPPALLRSMVAEGRLGKKTGRGFYEWS